VPELMQLDEQGYPVMLDMPVPPWLEREARQAVRMCPELALSLVAARADEPRQPATADRRPLPGPGRGQLVARARGELVVTEDWIAELSRAGDLN
jgi:hypothetical protein